MTFMRMAPLWTLILSLTLIPGHAVNFHGSSFVSVKSGERVTLNCTFRDEHNKDLLVWYKQQFGEMPVEVGKMIAHKDTEMSLEFRSGFKIENIMNGISLSILQTKKSDEGLYFCGISFWSKVEFSNGTFVAVTDDSTVKVSVSQSSVLDSVPAGASVTLQCSVLSESRAAELQVLWFRAAPPQSHPQIIYTHHNSSHQCESSSSTHTCVYNFSKNILSLNDTGTYYCAVATCGKIVIGNGTRVQLADRQRDRPDSVVICLVVVLVVCVVVNFTQAVLYCKKLNSVKRPHGSLIGTPHIQDQNAVDLNYAALSFNEKKTKSGRTNRGQPHHSVYSEVIFTPDT
ncbi:uncharacterized protein Hap1MRO34_012781 [Clarias gariepinus]